jgi:hypothetical protein
MAEHINAAGEHALEMDAGIEHRTIQSLCRLLGFRVAYDDNRALVAVAMLSESVLRAANERGI